MWCQCEPKPAPLSMPQTLCSPVWAKKPPTRAKKVVKLGAVKSGRNEAIGRISDVGS